MKAALVLGSTRDDHAEHVVRSLNHAGVDAFLFDTSLYPCEGAISWDPTRGNGLISLKTCSLPFNAINSVFWSSVLPPNGSLSMSSHGDIAQQDATSMLNTFFEAGSIQWFNHLSVYRAHKAKPIQLWHAARLGLSVPDTYVGNDPFIAKQFIESHAKTIFKPVYGGAETQLVHKKHCDTERLSRVLKRAPVTLQAYIEGTNVRTYAIGDRVFSAEIQSRYIDFRLDQFHRVKKIRTPTWVAEQAIRVSRAFGMNWTAIDWRMTPSGEYVFLEANPSPMFISFEKHSGHPITECLVEALSSCHHHQK